MYESTLHVATPQIRTCYLLVAVDGILSYSSFSQLDCLKSTKNVFMIRRRFIQKTGKRSCLPQQKHLKPWARKSLNEK